MTPLQSGNIFSSGSVVSDTLKYGVRKTGYIRTLFREQPECEILSVSSVIGLSGVYLRNPFVFRDQILVDPKGIFSKNDELLFGELQKFLGNSTISDPRTHKEGVERHRKGRKIVNAVAIPSKQKLNAFCQIIDHHLDRLDRRLEQHIAQRRNPRIVDELTHYTLGVICEIFFGFDNTNSLLRNACPNAELSDFIDAKRTIIRYISKKLFRAGVDNPLKHSKYLRSLTLINDIARWIERHSTSVFLASLRQQFPDNRPYRVDQVKGLIFAGLHTTATSLVMLLHHVDQSRHSPTNIEQLFLKRTEDEVFIKNMYREALRLSPPQPQIGRTAAQDTELILNGARYFLEAGTRVAFDIGFANQDFMYWPEATVKMPLSMYYPDRFVGLEQQRLPDCNVFAGGSSSCSGKMLAYLEVERFIKKLLPKYKFRFLSEPELYDWFILAYPKNRFLQARVMHR